MSSTAPPAPSPAAEASATLFIQLRESGGGVRHVPLAQGSFRIGSSLECDLVLAGLARNHLLVTRVRDAVTVTDLGGAGRARLNGLPLEAFDERPWPLRSTVVVGSPTHTLTLVSDLAAPQADQALPVLAAAPQPELSVTVEPGEQRIRPGRALELRVAILNSGPVQRTLRVILASEGALGAILQQAGAYQDVNVASAATPELLTFTVTIERLPTSRAGKYAITVELTDLTSGERVEPATVSCSATIEPYYTPPPQLEVLEFGQRRTSRTPLQRSDPRQVIFRLRAKNPSNTTTFYRLNARPDTEDVSCRLSTDLLVVEPGDQRSFDLFVQAKNDVNYRTPRTVSVTASPTGLQVSPIAAPPLIFLHIPPRSPYWWVPWALLALLLALVALAVAGFQAARRVQEASAQSQTSQAATLRPAVIMVMRNELRTSVAIQQLTQIAAITSSLQLQVDGTSTAQSIAYAAITAQAQTLQPALDAATALVNERADQANREVLAQTVTAQVGSTAQAIGATSQAEVAAIAQRATAEAGQTASAVAAATILVQAQQQQTTFAQSRTEVAQNSLRATELAAPASLVMGPVQQCVGKGQPLDTVFVTVLDGTGQRARTAVITVSLELQPVDVPSAPQLGGGETRRQSDDGIARFFGLTINQTGKYRLLARSGRWNPAQSEAIEVLDGSDRCGAASTTSLTPGGIETGQELPADEPPLLGTAVIVAPLPPADQPAYPAPTPEATAPPAPVAPQP